MSDSAPDIIFHNGQITTLDRANPNATAVAIKNGRFLAVGLNQEIMVLPAQAPKSDLKGFFGALGCSCWAV